MEEEYNRIDYFRGIAALTVIIGHCIQSGSGKTYIDGQLYFDNQLFMFIYSFHIPLFMLISGYLYHHTVQKDVRYIIRSRTIRLVVPALAWGVVNSIYDMAIQGYMDVSGMGYVVTYILKQGLFSVWYLWAVFFCSMLVLVGNRVFEDSAIFYVIVFILTFITPDRYNLHLYKYMYPYFVIAYFIGKRDMIDEKSGTLRKYRYVITVMTILIFLILFRRFDRDSYIYTSFYKVWGSELGVMHQFGVDIYRMIIGFCGCSMILLLSWIAYEKIPAVFKRLFVILGKESLGLYVVGGFLVSKFLPVITSDIAFHLYILSIETICSLVLSIGCIQSIRRSRTLRHLLLGGYP
ncbi:MAG: acyltransferase [Lachnospiraceae bacterium]|nr:acyltransferase [Lachnospiraceae bacterium]